MDPILAGVGHDDPVETEARVRTADGLRFLRLRYVPIDTGEAGGGREGYVTFEDVTEARERDRGDRMRQELYEVTSDPGIDGDAKIRRLLELGREWFDLDNGFLSKIDEETGRYYVEQAVGDEFVGEGAEIDLSNTFCRRAIESDDVLGIYDAREEGYAEDPGYRESGIACYFGARVTVGGETYGTFCFFDDDPAGDPFSTVDRALLDMAARWVSYELERRERRRKVRRRNRAMAAAPVGITITDVRDAGSPIVYANPRFEVLTGYDVGEVVGRDHEFLYGDETDGETVDRIAAAVEERASETVELRYYRKDGTEFWAHVSVAPVTDEAGQVTYYVTFHQDVTARKRREAALESLHGTARELLTVETESGVADHVTRTAESVLDDAAVVLYRFDADENALVPASNAGSFEAVVEGDPGVVAAGSDARLWESFASDTPTRFEDPGTVDSWGFEESVDGGIVVLVGDHGVFVLVSTGGSVTDWVRQVFETLAATTEAAFDRIESETSLSEREAELEARNRRLQRQIQVTEIIRRIDRSLISAESREGIESAVCEQLAAADDVELAWIGDREDGDGDLTVRAWAGDDRGYLDAIAGVETGSEPATVAVGEGTPVVVDNVVEVDGAPWREHALSAGFGSVLSVPLSVTGHTHGVLTVYAEAPGAFGDLERDVFAELGENIASSIEATHARRALEADSFVELTVRVEDPDAPLVRIASETEASVEYEGLAARSDDLSRLFVSVRDTRREVVDSVLSELVTVADYQFVDREDERVVFEVSVRGDDLPSRIARAGANPRRLHVRDGAAEAVVDVPATTDVREFVEELGERHPEVELLARQSVERSDRREESVASMLEELTDRQRETLRTSYLAGFFEWPRESTGEEVAEMLGVSQPTANRHLRLAQQRLLEQLFEDVDDPDDEIEG